MLKYLSLFSGIGAFESALTNLGVDYEVVNYCEIDKFASKSYSAIHGIPETKNLWDITKINVFNLPKDVDLVTYGFPCQDISLAGHQKGLFNEDGSLTRSGLFFKALDVIEYCKPKVAIAENVKNLVGKKFKPQFETVLKSLEDVGYNNYWKVLNAKNYGIPQNRERVFIVSIRKDIDNGNFKFPEPFELKLRLKDMLDDEVDEKYYLSEKQVNSIKTSTYTQNVRRIQEKDVCDTLCARDWKDPKRIGGLFDTETSKHQAGSIWDKECISPTIDTMQGGYRQPLVTIDDNVSNDEIKINVIGNYSPSGHDASRIVDENGLAPTVKENHGTVTATMQNLRIRKLTPKECWRLMGFTDEDFKKAQKFNSNTQLYKQAGNSIVIDVLEELFCMMLDEDGELYV